MLTPQFPRRPYTFLAWRELPREREAGATGVSPETAVGQPR
jgi:hypothetical protein